MDEGVPHAEALVELPHRDRLVPELGERLQPALKDLRQIRQRRLGRRR
jgi:hypothetical protein